VSFLAPLFCLGLGALGLPVVLHLARRRTLRELSWSSLRFVRPAPVRHERRRRLEDVLLLLLRCLLLAALVLAFTRPFATRALPAQLAPRGTRNVLLVDTSASMRRAGFWDAALARARAQLRAAGPDDRVAILAFADRPRTILGFDDWERQPAAQRSAFGEARLAALVPGWGGSDLGRALVAAADAVVDDEQAAGSTEAPGGAAGVHAATVTLLSDLQESARVDALGAAVWPGHVALAFAPLVDGSALNLAVHPVALGGGRADLAPAAPPRVQARIVASGAAGGAAPVVARLRWAEGGTPIEVSLAPGESRTVDAPASPGIASAGGTLLLEGDAEPFDNRLVVAPVAPVQSRIVYVGDDDGTQPGSFYFLSRAFPNTRVHAPEVVAHKPDDPAAGPAIARADLVVATAGIAPALLPALRGYLAEGHTFLFAPTSAAAGESLAALGAGVATARFREGTGRGHAILTAVDVSHPLLASFAEGHAGDFTHIGFWQHRMLDLGSGSPARVLARFDDGAPAWVTAPAGRGQIFIMTSGWDSRDSQLGVSSKLVPLLWSLLESGGGAAADLAPVFVGDSLIMRRGPGAFTIERPDGTRVPATADTPVTTDLPGLYRISRAGAPASAARVVAVNVPPGESVTTPMPLDRLERAGLRFAGSAGLTTSSSLSPAPVSEERRRASFFATLEGEQKLWRWPLAAALLLLAGESLLSARSRRRSPSPDQVAA
jgi:hypothetical protein